MKSGSERPLPGRLLVVTDRHQAAKPLADLAAELFAAGLRWLWLRDKDLPPDERRALAHDLARHAARQSATLIVGADTALAAEVGAGVQFGTNPRLATDIAAARQRLAADARIGVSAHSLADLRAARDAGADYATLSPIFLSASKPGYGPALGLAALREAAAVGLPVLALGGVSVETTKACRDAGSAGVAVMGQAMRGGPGVVADVLRVEASRNLRA